MLPDKSIKCPATGFTKTCHSIVTKCTCPKWVHIQGEDPQKKETFDVWGCVDTFLPKLLIDGARQQAQTCASIDRFNNEMVQQNANMMGMQVHMDSRAALSAPADLKVVKELPTQE